MVAGKDLFDGELDCFQLAWVRGTYGKLQRPLSGGETDVKSHSVFLDGQPQLLTFFELNRFSHHLK